MATLKVDPDHDVKNRVTLNVGGVRFDTLIPVLKKIPATRLSRLTHALANYDKTKNEYYFDRHPGVFSQILNYYRTGKLHYPQCVCGPLFEEELVFWGIDSNQVEPCCWKTYTNHRQTEETLMTLEKLNIDVERTSAPELNIKFAMDQEPGFPDNLSKFKQIQPMVWQMFEEPRSSTQARLIASIQIIMISLSTVSLWFQSYPMTDYLTLKMENQDIYNKYVSTLNQTNGSFVFENEEMSNKSIAFIASLRILDNPQPTWLVLLDYLTLSWYLIDFAVRFIFSPDKNMYFFNFNNTIDIIATIWLIIDLIANNFITSFLLHSLLLLVLVIFSTLYGSLIFFAEKLTQSDPSENMFISIPDAFWFSLVSLTTIGYGDITPVTLVGKLIGCACVITGVLMIGLPMTIVVEVFSNYYKHLGARSKMPKERRRICPVEAPRARKKAAPKPGA